MRKNIAIMIFCAVLPICTEECRGMIPDPEEFDFFTPIGKFAEWACNQKEGAMFAGTWATFVTTFKSDDYGGRCCIDIGIGMHEALKEYFKYFQCDGFYDGNDHAADGILSKYLEFAAAFGNTNDPSKPECYYVTAKDDEASSSKSRRREDMLNGIGEDFSLNCDGCVGNTRKVNAFLQLLLLTEIAETGTINWCYTDGIFTTIGYNFSTLSKFYKLMSVIME
jgi:hypothetical protein